MLKWCPEEASIKMLNSVFGNQLAKLRKEKKISLQKLANELNQLALKKNIADQLTISKSMLSRWESNKTTPKINYVQLIADYFGVTPQFFTTEISSNQDTTPTINSPYGFKALMHLYCDLNTTNQEKVYKYTQKQLSQQKIAEIQQPNIISMSEEAGHNANIWVNGILSAGIGEFMDDNSTGFQTAVPLPIPDHYDFAFKINGNSMFPYYTDGQVVFVKQETDYRDGQTVAAVMDGCAYLKRLSLKNGQVILVSLNTDYPNISVNPDDELKIIGVVFS